MHELVSFCSFGCFEEMVNFRVWWCRFFLFLFLFLSTICNCGVLISTTHNKGIKLCHWSIFLCARHFSHDVIECKTQKNIVVRRYLHRYLFRGKRPNAPMENANPDAKDANSTGLKGTYTYTCTKRHLLQIMILYLLLLYTSLTLQI